ncbi:unnamed protein product [Gordionus sp. m RMFG-2023]|uniref:uncharacterized protein LOC135922992 n=1 Tax=Gordionus sp. m RMFG-2023 TaxID=3053472 RepID=UPI0030E5D1EC
MDRDSYDTNIPSSYPRKIGLYDPIFEKDSCGAGCIVNINGIASHQILKDARLVLERMEHRGACGCDSDTGDGAGVMSAIPHAFYVHVLRETKNIELPKPGKYATGLFFLSPETSDQCREIFEKIANERGMKILAWRTMPIDNTMIGKIAKDSEPLIVQVFMVPRDPETSELDFKRKLYMVRKYATHRIPSYNLRFYICSLSLYSIVYKGQFRVDQLWLYYDDLRDQMFETHFALVHSRFSTNTFPSWERAQPLRYVCHNGEINTLRGNVNFMRAREGIMKSPVYGDQLSMLYPVVEEGVSDSGALDNALEFLIMAGERSLPEAITNLIPEARKHNFDEDSIEENLKNQIQSTCESRSSSIKQPISTFYKWVSNWMEPWDGPALVLFGGDGRHVGAALDRNGLRPARYYLTSDGILVLASEVGVFDVEQQGRNATGGSYIVKKGRLKPGKMILVDTLTKALIEDQDIKLRIAMSKPFTGWLAQKTIKLKDLYTAHYAMIENGELPPKSPARRANGYVADKSCGDVIPAIKDESDAKISSNDLSGNDGKMPRDGILHDRRLPIFGFTAETVNMLVLPMIKQKKEALGSMGNDTPLACLSEYSPAVFDYFKQMFAQVTNPAIDPFREKNVMSLSCWVGPATDPLSTYTANEYPTKLGEYKQPRIYLEQPVLSCDDMEVIKATRYRGLKTKVIDLVFPLSQGVDGLEAGIDRVCTEAAIAVESGYSLVVLSDRFELVPEGVPIPALMALGAVHHFLLSKKLRLKTGLIVETGAIRQVAHICLLLGYGADAVCPYLVYELVAGLRDENLLFAPDEEVSFYDDRRIFENFRDAAEKGISKVMAKMGISTLHSYKGAQIFEAVGLGPSIIEKCFKGTPSRLGGITFQLLASELLAHQFEALGSRHCDNQLLLDPGFYHWREGGEKHSNSPAVVANLQRASKTRDLTAYAAFSEASTEASAKITLRGQLAFDFEEMEGMDAAKIGGIVPLKGTVELINGTSPMNGHDNDGPSVIPGSIDIDMVEDSACIVKRFCTGAMSLGSISSEAHRTLARAMNTMGGKSNTGEGGEDPSRYEQGNLERSSIKQVASGRFGVTSTYLTNADVLQIKIAQGAKPGEGGELPGYKVTHEIARTRHSIPGVGLISPPPHHDIYSVEDLAELIYDLKSASPSAKISVKLVSQVGVGVVAAGVAKCKAEHITISGHDGGTGASSWTGIKHAGLPWELGLAEAHQTLLLNNLRSRVILQTDGQIRTGRDVVMAALLGADEVAFSTAPLITLGCTMMRKCHLNTCPVGIATQDPDLRKKFAGKPEYVINYLFMIAEEAREYMAKLGFRTFEEMVGHSEKLVVKRHPINQKVASLNLRAILDQVVPPKMLPLHKGGTVAQEFRLDAKLENTVMKRVLEHVDSIPLSLTHTLSVEQLPKSKQLLLTLKIANTDRAFGALLSHVISKRFGESGLPPSYPIKVELTGFAGQSFGAFLAPGLTLRLEGDANDYVGKGLSGGEIIVYPPPSPATFAFDTTQNICVGNACLYGAVSGRAFFRGQAAERFCVRNSGAIAVCEGVGDHGCEYMTGGKAVILGIPGRNFAAGMSGGIAYVYDPTRRRFPARCNMAMIDLESIYGDSTANDAKFSSDDHSEDLKFLRDILGDFIEKTGSEIAREILEGWPASAAHFFKVFPKDYRTALEEINQKNALEKAGKSQQDILKELKLYKQESLLENKLDDPYEDEIGIGVEDIEDSALVFPNGSVHPDENGTQDSAAYRELKRSPIMNGKTHVGVAIEKKDVPEKLVLANGDSNGHTTKPEVLDKTRGFVKYKRHKNPYRPVQDRMKDWGEIYDHKKVKETLRVQAARCMDCGVPFCQSNSGCPLGNIIPKWNDLVFKNNWREALETLLQTNNFPEFTGRVCPAPCEGACVLGINEPPVNIKNIECAIIDHAFSQGWITVTLPAVRTGKLIAIVGGGPAALAAAAQLNKAGHYVTVYERNDSVGGLLRYGIPSMKLGKNVLQRRIDLLANEGVTFKVNQPIGMGGADLPKSTEFLKAHHAVLLAVGSTQPRDLPIPGRNLQGIHFAMEFLEGWQKRIAKHSNNNVITVEDCQLSQSGKLMVQGKNIIVIGGGDTGVDCIATSLRLSAKSVVTFEILPEPPQNRAPSNPWPEWPKVFKVDYGHEESLYKQDKDPRVFCIMSKEFVESQTNPGHIGGIKTALIEWEKTPTGVWCMKEKPGSEKTYEADLILLALGFLGPEKKLLEFFELETDLRGNIATPRKKYCTANPKIYAAGDCRRGQSLVVWAINEGRQAARLIDIDLMGKTSLAGPGGIVHTLPKMMANRAN